MKPFIHVLLLILMTTSCSLPKTTEQIHRSQDSGRTHWLVVRVTGPLPELVAITMFLGGNNCMNQTALTDDEWFIPDEHIVTIRIRVHSPGEVGQILCLLHRYPVSILSIDEM